MNDMEMLSDLARETPLAKPAGLAPARSRLAAAIAAERSTERTGRPATRHGGSHRWQLALTAAAATLAAGVAAATVVVSSAPAKMPHGSQVADGRSRASFGPATTPDGVLRNAELAALQLPASAPKPGQFVYSKVIVTTVPGGTVARQDWLSADGARVGLRKVTGDVPLRGTSLPLACVDGYQYPVVEMRTPQGLKPVSAQEFERIHYLRSIPKFLSCNPELFAAYLPAMPDTPNALRAYLLRRYQDRFIIQAVAGDMLMHDLPAPEQRAALYEVLTRTPGLGLTLVPRVTTMQGKVGIGVRGGAKGGYSTLIFDPTTYALLGINTTFGGGRNGEVQAAFGIVNKPGQLP